MSNTASNGFAPDSALVFAVHYFGRAVGQAFRYGGQTRISMFRGCQVPASGLIFRYKETVGEQRARFHPKAV